MTMPLIGRVDAVGLSTTELSKLIAHRLDEKYLHDPNVTIALKDSASRVVTVDGSVTQPGTFPVLAPLTLIQAVSLAKGTNELANPHRVAIFRTDRREADGGCVRLDQHPSRDRAQDPEVSIPAIRSWWTAPA